MKNVGQVHSINEFQRDASEHLRRLKASGRPEVIAVDGAPDLVIQSAEAYDQLVREAEFARHVKSLRRSISEADDNRGRPMRDVIADIARQHNIEL